MAVDFVDLRRKMVDNQIRTVDVTNLGVLAAFLQVEREDFVPEAWRDFAYLDSDIDLKEPQDSHPARTLMRPAALARLLQLAQISQQDSVLDVGATTGYASAILAHLAASVVALDYDEELSSQAQDILQSRGVETVKVVCGDLSDGYAPAAPYDVILCEGSVDFVPQPLFDQLREKGRLVVVEGKGLAGEARLYIKEAAGLSMSRAFNLSVAPLAGFQHAPGFVF